MAALAVQVLSPERAAHLEAMRDRYPFYFAYVPKDIKENLAFRRRLIEWSANSFENKQTLWMICKRDPLFWLNVFIYTHDPKLSVAGKYPITPFVTYPQQDEVFDDVYTSIGFCDVVIEKSRQAGASWLCLMAFLHKWQFSNYLSFLLLSAKLELVDKPDVPKCLFYKLEFGIKNQPLWMQPSFNKTFAKLVNHDTGSVIDGEATTGDMGRGSTQTCILMDEFASVLEDEKAVSATRDCTASRIMNSTPAPGRGKNCEFYKQTQKPNIKKVRMHWTDHPVKAEGLYYDDKGKPRSPWYDKQCERAASPAEIACELDINYEGASSQFFSQDMIERLKGACREPVASGSLLFDEDSLKDAHFEADPKGELLLWDEPPSKTERNQDGKWSSEYTMGVDISYGTRATNSTFSVTDKKTGTKVAQCSNCTMKPYEWAKLCVAVAKWFNNAFMAWEANGPGSSFGYEVVKTGYRNIFYRKRETRVSPDDTPDYGWYSTPENKQKLLSAYQKGLAEGSYTNLSAPALDETLSYIFLPTGGVEHSGTIRVSDGSAARINHGDMVIADALSFKGITEQPYRDAAPEADKAPYLSFAWRLEQREERKRQLASGGAVW